MRLDGGYGLGSVYCKNESFFRLRAGQRGVPREGLTCLYPLARLGRGDDLARGVACDTALVVLPPGVRETLLGVEAPAVREGPGEGMAGTGGFVPHPSEDGVARFLPAGGLGVRVLEIHDPGEVGVEPAALGADDEHRAASQSASAGDRVPVDAHPLLRGGDQHGSEHAAPPARGLEARRRLALVRSGPQGGRSLRYGGDGIGAEPPVALDSFGVEDVSEG